MLCCIIAMLIISHCVAIVRRWGIFWGVVRPRHYEDPSTAIDALKAAFVRAPARAALSMLLFAATIAGGGWLYFAHGTHIYQEGDMLVSALQGERVVYSGYCSGDGKDRSVRIVLADTESPKLRTIRF